MRDRHPAVVPTSVVRYYGPGQRCPDPQPNDLVLVRSPGLLARLIRFAERLRMGVPRQFAWCNHAAILVWHADSYMVAQETASGQILSPLSVLDKWRYAVVRVAHAEPETQQFALWALGSGYGWLSIFAGLLNALTGVELGLGTGNRMVCSTVACRAMERSGLIPDRSPYSVTPAHLARYFDATWPETQSSIR